MPKYIECEAIFKIVADIMCDCKVRHKGRAINRNIKQLPTADVVEVKHGYWKWFAPDSKVRTCSNCHISQTVNVYKDTVMFEYCPYCGAKMDLT